MIAFIWLTSPTNAQDSIIVYIGNVDGSPFHVPNQGIANIPVWIIGPDISGGRIKLLAYNNTVSDLLGGNFYIPGDFNFGQPQYFQDCTVQTLAFAPDDWPIDQLFHLADFTIRMGADSTFIGVEVDALRITSGTMFSDPDRVFLYQWIANISLLAIDDAMSTGEPENGPESFILYPAYPNPFNSSTTISFNVGTEGIASLYIFDVTGRKVRSFEMGNMPAGEKSIVWDGTDDNHISLSSGTYFYRLECDNSVATSRVTLLK